MNDQTQTPAQTGDMQNLQCRVCQKVTMADGTQVWVCKECGTEHQPGQAQVVDEVAAQAAVDQAAASAPVTPPAAPSDSTSAPAAPVDSTQKPTV